MDSKEPGKDFFDNFTHSVSAARLLLSKAHDEGNFIEGIVLYASIIDAFLRNLVALKTGIMKEKGVVSLDPRYFYHDNTKWMDERAIYREALACGVIGQTLFEKLEGLYLFRNRVIHRFIISNITYPEIAPKLIQYEKIYTRLYRQLKKIEQPLGNEPALTDEQRVKIYKRLKQKIYGGDL